MSTFSFLIKALNIILLLKYFQDTVAEPFLKVKGQTGCIFLSNQENFKRKGTETLRTLKY